MPRETIADMKKKMEVLRMEQSQVLLEKERQLHIARQVAEGLPDLQKKLAWANTRISRVIGAVKAGEAAVSPTTIRYEQNNGNIDTNPCTPEECTMKRAAFFLDSLLDMLNEEDPNKDGDNQNRFR